MSKGKSTIKMTESVKEFHPLRGISQALTDYRLWKASLKSNTSKAEKSDSELIAYAMGDRAESVIESGLTQLRVNAILRSHGYLDSSHKTDVMFCATSQGIAIFAVRADSEANTVYYASPIVMLKESSELFEKAELLKTPRVIMGGRKFVKSSALKSGLGVVITQDSEGKEVYTTERFDRKSESFVAVDRLEGLIIPLLTREHDNWQAFKGDILK